MKGISQLLLRFIDWNSFSVYEGTCHYLHRMFSVPCLCSTSFIFPAYIQKIFAINIIYSTASALQRLCTLENEPIAHVYRL